MAQSLNEWIEVWQYESSLEVSVEKDAPFTVFRGNKKMYGKEVEPVSSRSKLNRKGPFM